MSKIVSDSRYSLLNAKERKQEFDRYTHGSHRLHMNDEACSEVVSPLQNELMKSAKRKKPNSS